MQRPNNKLARPNGFSRAGNDRSAQDYAPAYVIAAVLIEWPLNKKGLYNQMQRPNNKLAMTYSPTCYRSTISAKGLNFSVRNGKRWTPSQ